MPRLNLLWNSIHAIPGRAGQNLPHTCNPGSVTREHSRLCLWLFTCPDPGPVRNLTQHLFYSHLLSVYYPKPGRMGTRSRAVPHTHTYGALKKQLLTDCRNLSPVKADGSVNPAHTWNFIVVIRSLYSPGELSYKYLHNCYLWIFDNRIVEDQQTCNVRNASHRADEIQSRSFMFPTLRKNNAILNITSPSSCSILLLTFLSVNFFKKKLC